MPYCTSNDVVSEFKAITISSANTSVITSEVDAFIAEADAEIDGRVGTKYVVPIDSNDSPNAALILKTIAIALVKSRVKSVLKIRGTAKDTEQNADDKVDAGTMTATEARKKLKDIVAGLLLLSDASLIDSDDGVNSYLSDVDTDFEPTFKRGTLGKREPDQW